MSTFSSGGAGDITRKETFKFKLENVTIHSPNSEGKAVHLHGEQLIIDQLPMCFEEQYGPIPRKIFVRECYRSLYDNVSEHMLSGAMRRGVTLFTGVPGIGKSLFLVYFIYRFLHDDRFQADHNCFALEFAHSVYTLFTRVPNSTGLDFACTVQPSSSIYDKNFLLLCDINANEEPACRAKWTFIFSSPASTRYKEIMKNKPWYMYTLPTWSEQELMFANADVKLWYEDFVRFGGVPRHVLPGPAGDSRILLLKALEEKGGLVAEGFFKSGFGTIDMFQSYMLVHINPPTVDGDYVYGGRAKYTFASDYIYQWLNDKYQAIMLAGAVGMFNAGAAPEAYGAVSAGHLFEKVCLYSKPLRGQSITAASLSGGGDFTFDIPAEKYELPNDWKKTAVLPVDKLISPRILNLKAGDAFYVIRYGLGSYMLVVLQITVGKTHPVKSNGLKDILMAFPMDVRENITKKALVFVTPVHGTLENEQPLVTQKGNNPTVLPLIVRGFEQYVFKYKLSIQSDNA